MKKYKRLEHSGDLRIKVFGKSKKEVVKNACLGMFDSILEKPLDNYSQKDSKQVTIKGDGFEDLFVNFLNELIYLNDVHNLVFQVLSIEEISDKKLKAKLGSYKVPSSDYTVELKAATRHNLKLKKTEDGYEIILLFDI